MVVCLFPHRKLYVDLKEVIFLTKRRSRYFPLRITDRLYTRQSHKLLILLLNIYLIKNIILY